MDTLTEAPSGTSRGAAPDGRKVTRRKGTGRIAAASAKRPWLTLTIWLLAIVGLGAASTSLQLVDGDNSSEIESDVADDLYALHAADDAGPTEVIVVSSDSLVFSDAVFAARVSALAVAARGVEGVV